MSKQILELTDYILFGQYELQYTVKEVIDKDPNYFDWLLSNPVKKFTFSMEAYNYYRKLHPKTIPANPNILW